MSDKKSEVNLKKTHNQFEQVLTDEQNTLPLEESINQAQESQDNIRFREHLMLNQKRVSWLSSSSDHNMSMSKIEEHDSNESCTETQQLIKEMSQGSEQLKD